ncbi:MAG: lipid-binding SYLF domain-containing protein [Acidobacteria bacterium]|nr:lipid-binding SYLF domain-containing protein [Acidobacteriota bacterium]
MKRFLLFAAVILLNTPLLDAASKVNDRVVSAAVALKEMAQASDGSIPGDLLDKCSCVAVIPGLKKGGFIFGASYGKGVIACRTQNGDGPWSAPTMLQLTGGSFGLQIGVQSVDLVLLIMNVSGIESLLDSKFTLGGDASVAAGPIGRTAAAETDAWMTARILTYSRARGIFGGLVVKGGTVRPDKDANFVLYGRHIEPRQVLFRPPESVPDDAQIFLKELNRISPKRIIE